MSSQEKLQTRLRVLLRCSPPPHLLLLRVKLCAREPCQQERAWIYRHHQQHVRNTQLSFSYKSLGRLESPCAAASPDFVLRHFPPSLLAGWSRCSPWLYCVFLLQQLPGIKAGEGAGSSQTTFSQPGSSSWPSGPGLYSWSFPLRASGSASAWPHTLPCSAQLAVLLASRYLGSSEDSREEQRRHRVLWEKAGAELAEGWRCLPAHHQELVWHQTCSPTKLPQHPASSCPSDLQGLV